MPIGHRLSEERARLEWSQDELATIADVTRRSVSSWEKGDGPTPNAEALAALHRAGMDVLYVVTGNRETRLPAAQEAYNALTAQAFCDALEARFHQLSPWPLSEEVRASLSPERAELDRIARLEALPDKVRARADQMLWMAFEDAEASDRLDARFRAISRRIREADATIERAARIAGTEAPPLLKANLMKLVSDYAIDPEDLAPLLSLVVTDQGE